MKTDHSLRIALAVPEWQPLYQVMNDEPVDATYVLQGYLAKGLASHGHRISFVAPQSVEEVVFTTDPHQQKIAPRTWSASKWFDTAGKSFWKVQSWLGVPYLNIFSNYRFFDACLHSLPGHDLVYERNGLYNSGVAMACQRLKIPYAVFFEADQIMEFDIMNKPISGLLRWRAQQILRYNLESADCIVCVSEPAKTHLINNWRVPGDKIVVFPNAVDVQQFQSDPDARAEVRRTWGIQNNPLIMFVGNFFYWHDVTTLLDAFTVVLKSHPETRLVLVGDGEHRQAMMQYARNIGISQSAIFTGIVPHTEVPRLLSAADMAVVPYPPLKQECWLSPLKLFEYMASQKAVIASAVGQVKAVIRDGENGMLVPPGDAGAMAIAMNQLIDDPALLVRMGKQAREDAVQQYSWSHYLSRLENLFSTLIARQSVSAI